MAQKCSNEELVQVAIAIRDACITAARDAYEEAGLSGLCAEGRWENAVGAVETLDLQKILAAIK
ncbi:MAG: acetyltransferase [Spirochaetes bacterium]|nr:acetyltransferase [Spirochaetota bacterium]